MSEEDNTSATSATPSTDDSDVPVPMTVNTFLAYAQYCLSCATSDNTHHVLCSHFSADEISEAKDVLWDKLQLSEVKRANSSNRSASEANVSDIMGALYKMDRSSDYQQFYVDPTGIGRLPRFNPESLNIVAIDQRIAELMDHCRVLQGQVDSYRTLAIKCSDKLDEHDTVLLQYCNMLREIKDQPSSKTPVVLNSTVTRGSNVLHVKNSTVTRGSNVLHVKKKPITTHNSLYVTQHAGRSVSLPNLHDEGNHKKREILEMDLNYSPSLAWKDVENSNSLKPSTLQNLNKSTATSDGQANLGRKMDDNEDSREFCVFDSQQDKQKEVTDDGFLDNPLDKRRQRQRENRRNKVVRGSAKTLGSRFVGGADKKRLCDIFVYHVAKQSTLQDLKYHLKQQNFNTDSMRIDITSNKAATYKSFRIIAPGELRDILLDSEVWPIDVRVREYDIARPNKIRNGPNKHEYRSQNG